MPSSEEYARAKVNLSLRVVGRRPDGYHDLESVVAFADVGDHLTLEPGPALELVMAGPGAQDCGASDDNLVLKAARLLAERVDGLKAGRLTLDKQLPVASGIGGGSADAAAALRLLARLNDIAADDARILDAALRTGADVPVCVGSRACVMSGVGDHIAPMALPSLPCVLVNPRIPVATAAVFRTLGLKPGELRVGITDVVAAKGWPADGADANAWFAALNASGNDLEAPALEVEPRIGDVLDALRGLDGVQLARMSGSGATCFALLKDPASAQAAGERLSREHPNWWVHAGILS